MRAREAVARRHAVENAASCSSSDATKLAD
jgi:hypothetical protein